MKINNKTHTRTKNRALKKSKSLIQTDLNCEIHSIHIWIALMSQMQTNPTKKKTYTIFFN